MSYSKTFHDIGNILHDDMSCEVLVNCNHTFYLKILWVISNIWICTEATTNYAAVV